MTTQALVMPACIIERIGLPQVRNYRLAQLEQEERQSNSEMGSKASALPELSAVVLVRVAAGGEIA